MGYKIKPNKHIEAVNIQFVISELFPVNKKLIPINIIDINGYVFINRPVKVTINKVVYDGVIHLGYSSIQTTNQYYLEIKGNHPEIAKGVYGNIKVSFKVRDYSENITLQDVYNELLNNTKQQTLIIDGVTVYNTPNLVTGQSSTSGSMINRGEFTVSELNVISQSIPFINNIAEISIKSDNLKITQTFKITVDGDSFDIERIDNNNYSYLSFGFNFVRDTNGIVYLHKIGIYQNIKTVELPQKFTLFVCDVKESYATLDESKIQYTFKSDSLYSPTHTPPVYNYYFDLSTNKIGQFSFERYNNGGLMMDAELLDENIDFNKLLFAESFQKPIDTKNKLTYINTPVSLVSLDFMLINQYLFDWTTGKYIIVQNLHTVNEHYIRTLNGSTWSAWRKLINHEHSSNDIDTTGTDRLFVTKEEKDRWDNAAESYWLKPVNLATDLPKLKNSKVGHVVYVINEKIHYFYDGTNWLPRYKNATKDSDGLLTKELFVKLTNMEQSTPFLTTIPAKSLFFESFNNQKETDYKNNTIDAVHRGKITTGISGNTVAFGLNTEASNTGAITGASDNSTFFGINLSIKDSKNSLLIGGNSHIYSGDSKIGIGYGLKLENNTKYAVGHFNMGNDYFEFGNGTANDKRSNLFSFSQTGMFNVKSGISSTATIYSDGDNPVEIQPSEITTYTKNGGFFDLYNINDDILKVDPATGKLQLFKPIEIDNPDYVDEETTPNVPEKIREKINEFEIGGGIKLKYDADKRIVTDDTEKNVIAQTPIFVSDTKTNSEALVRISKFIKTPKILNNTVIVLTPLSYITSSGIIEYDCYIDMDLGENESFIIKIIYGKNWTNSNADVSVQLNFDTTVFPKNSYKRISMNPEYDNNFNLYGDFSTVLITKSNGKLMCKFSQGILKE